MFVRPFLALAATIALAGVYACEPGAQPCVQTMAQETDEQAYLQLGGPFDLLEYKDGDKMTAVIDAFIRDQMCKQRVAGLGLGIVWQGNLVYIKGYGLARGWHTTDPGDDVQVRNQRTRFRWASVSKTVTGLASKIAAQEIFPSGASLYDLDVSIENYRGCDDQLQNCGFGQPAWYYQGWLGDNMEDEDWPLPISFIPSLDEAILSPRRLLANRSGMQHYDDGDPDLSSGSPPEADRMANQGFVWAVDYVAFKPLLFVPGDQYNYSSFGFNMAGAALDTAVQGQGGYWPYVEARIAEKTEPAAMQFFHPDDIYDDQYAQAPWFTEQNRADGYFLDDDTNVVDHIETLTDVSYKLPGGGFISTIADMALYAEGLLNYRFLSQARSDEMWTPQRAIVEGSGSTPTTGYALGFDMAIRSGERAAIHNGAQQAARSRLVIFPDGEDPSVGKLGIVVMSNSEHLDAKGITDGVEALLREPLPEPEPENRLMASGDPNGTPYSKTDGRGRIVQYNDTDLDFLREIAFQIQTDHRYNPAYDPSISEPSPHEPFTLSIDDNVREVESPRRDYDGREEDMEQTGRLGSGGGTR